MLKCTREKETLAPNRDKKKNNNRSNTRRTVKSLKHIGFFLRFVFLREKFNLKKRNHSYGIIFDILDGLPVSRYISWTVTKLLILVYTLRSVITAVICLNCERGRYIAIES